MSRLIKKSSLRFVALLLLPLLIGMVLYSLTQVKKAEAGWWNETWLYRKAIPITNTSGSTLTNQMVKITLDTTSLIPTGKMQNDCDDLRLTDANGNLLNHWITTCDDTSAEVYVKTLSLPTPNTALYLYYGNSSAQNIQKQLGDINNPGTSCKMMLDQGSVITNGVYYIAPGGNYADLQKVYCDQTTDNGGWNLVMNQNILTGGYFSDLTEKRSFNEDNPTAGKYSIMNKLPKFNQDGKYTLKINWLDVPRRNIWSQTSNPSTDAISGYTAIDIDTTASGWGGLEYNGSIALADGTVNHSNWYYAIATTSVWSCGIPADNVCTTQTQLWVRGGDNMFNTLVGTPAAEEVTPGPVAFWKFDEGSGTTINDSSGQGNVGTNSSTSWADEATCISGKCLNFAGSGSVSIPDNNLLDFGTNSFTISGWALHRDYTYPKSNFMINKSSTCYTADHPGFDLGHGYNYNGIDVCFRDVSNNLARGDLIFDTGSQPAQLINQWVHYVFVFDRSQGKLLAYINGIKQSNEFNISAVTGSINNSSPLVIGTMYGWQTDGLIDEVKIYPYARTAKQIKTDYAAGASKTGSAAVFGHQAETAAIAPLTSKLIAHYKFDEGSGTSAKDFAGTRQLNFAADAAAPSWSSDGRQGGSLRCDGADYATPTSSYLAGTNNHSYTAWFKLDSSEVASNYYKAIFGSNQATPVVGYNPAVKRFAHYRQYAGGGQSIDWATTYQYADDQWHHVGITVDQGSFQVALYVDGKYVDTKSIGTEGYTHSNGAFRFVCRSYLTFTNNFWKGNLDNLKIYNATLTQEEILQDYNLGMGTVMGQAPATAENSAGSAGAEHCIPGDSSTCRAPVTEWLFDDNQGSTLKDNSGTNNVGTLVNTPTWSKGLSGSALNFNGSSSYVSFNNDLMSGKPAMSISAWFKTTDTNGAIVAQYQNSSGYSWQLNVVSSLLKACVGTTNSDPNCRDNAYLVESSIAVNDGRWHHGALAYDGANIHLYLDGQKIASAEKTGNIADPATALTTAHIGVQGYNYGSAVVPQNAGYLSGDIDQIRLYDYARTPAQIAWDYNRGAPIGHWKLDECQGNVAYDTSANANHGTINIGTTLPQTSLGSCSVTDTATSWYNGRECAMGSCINLDGADDTVSIPNSTKYQFATNDFSISLWMKASEEINSYDVVFSKSSSLNHYEYVNALFSAYGELRWYLSDHNETLWNHYVAFGANAIFTNQWHHILLVRENTTIKAFLNGVLIDESTLPANYNLSSTSAITLGKGGSIGTYFPGSVDEVRIYNYALTPDQIKLLFNGDAAIRFTD